MRLLCAAAGCVLAMTLVAAQAVIEPHRVYRSTYADGGAVVIPGHFDNLDNLIVQASAADVLVLGEPLSQPAAHRLALTILEGLARRQRDVILALEVFDRMAQDPLDHFLMGHLTEAELLAAAGLGPRYPTDYKPLVDLAIARMWPVIATGAPHTLVADIARNGFRPDRARNLVSWVAQCSVFDEYFTRFQIARASGQPVAGIAAQDEPLDLVQAYRAQCLRDETIADRIGLTLAHARDKRPLVVSVNGAFRSDFYGGLVERIRRRSPGRRLVVVSFVPVPKLEAIASERPVPGSEMTTAEGAVFPRADYVVYFTAKP